MKNRIGTKIAVSFLVLLAISLILTTAFANYRVKNSLLKDTKKELSQQMTAIVKLIDEYTFEKALATPRVFRARIDAMQRLTQTHIIIFDNNKKLVYKSIEELSLDEAKELISGKNQDYLIVRREILNDETVQGTLVLAVEISQIASLQKTIRQAVMLAMFITMLIGSIFVGIIQRSIVKPIKKLEHEMMRYQNEGTLSQFTLHSGDEIQALSEVYNKMTHRIDQDTQERKRFFQNASHELKTPLMTIQGYAEAIKDGIVTGDEVYESLELIIQKSQNLKKTVEQMIYLSKLQNMDVPYVFERTNIIKYIDEQLSYFDVAFRENKIAIRFEKSCEESYVNLDQEKFAGVIENIVTNCLRYARSLIQLSVAESAQWVTIRILDDGQGFKEEEIPRLFERFFKGEKGNSGIGLALAKVIVEAHHGQIRGDNHISGGAAFEIKLPKYTERG